VRGRPPRLGLAVGRGASSSPALRLGPLIAGGLAAGAALLLFLVAVVLVELAPNGVSVPVQSPTEAPSGLAVSDIPPDYLQWYESAAQRYGIDWAILAGIGKVECDHGRDPDPSCTQEGATNSAGAGGPMQFLASTWAEYGVSVGGGPPDRWNPQDAIYGAANYLRASGAPGNYYAAIFAYNHAGWYVTEVEHWASVYRGAAAVAAQGSEPGVALTAGPHAVLSPDNGHIALAPAGAPPAVVAMIAAGNALQDLPYGPAGHPDPVGAPNEDCSSTVNYVLYRAGLRSLAEIIRDNPLAQSYPYYGLPGPGRWVTIYSTVVPTPHVFIVIAGLRLDTSHRGTDIGPNRDQDGPRWRILPYIPTWADWAVRHPPGL